VTKKRSEVPDTAERIYARRAVDVFRPQGDTLRARQLRWQFDQARAGELKAEVKTARRQQALPASQKKRRPRRDDITAVIIAAYETQYTAARGNGPSLKLIAKHFKCSISTIRDRKGRRARLGESS
jgi:hypothetical protein